MNKKRVAILFGAGAVIPWGGPKTAELTETFLESGFKDANGITVTKKIYDRLKAQKQSDINFETILNIIDELIFYWSCRNFDGSLKTIDTLISLLSFKIEELDDLSYYEIIQPEKSDRYSISIPGYEGNGMNNIATSVHPSYIYFTLLYKGLIDFIKSRVSDYSYYMKGNESSIYNTSNEKINSLFCNWISNIMNGDGLIRIYTLNYDRLFKVLFENNGFEIFDGFTSIKSKELEWDQNSFPNLKRIVDEKDSICHYNLHGSAFWAIDKYNINHLESYQVIQSPMPEFEFNFELNQTAIERGKPLLICGIVSGYQKVQRSSIAPLRQMLASFDRDCMHADKLIIVGYSLSDEHINDIIRNSVKHNQGIEINVIDPDFNSDLSLKLLKEFFSNWQPIEDFVFEDTNEKVLFSKQYNTRLYRMKFEEYLQQFDGK